MTNIFFVDIIILKFGQPPGRRFNMPSIKVNESQTKRFIRKCIALLVAAVMLTPFFSGSGKSLLAYAEGPEGDVQALLLDTETPVEITEPGEWAYFSFCPSEDG